MSLTMIYRARIRIRFILINFHMEFPIYQEIYYNDSWKYSGRCVLNINNVNKVIIPKKNSDYIKNNKNANYNSNNPDNKNLNKSHQNNSDYNKIQKKNLLVNNNSIIDRNKVKDDLIHNNDEKNNDENTFLILFDYNSDRIVIQGHLNEKMENIINRFILKSSVDKDKAIFLYGGTIIKKESLLLEIISSTDKSRKQMNILVNSNDPGPHSNEINTIIKSKEVICPKCSENINLKIKNYEISLYDCKNGHIFNSMRFKDFIDTQNIDLKKIKCDECKERNKYDSFNNVFYKCFTCNKNLCPICKSIHNSAHQVSNYDKINSICIAHFESFNSYCRNCKNNLCLKCEKDHINHDKIYYGSILSEPDEIKIKLKKLERNIIK